MKTIKVKYINQDDAWCQSFNVLVPLEIQGRSGTLLKAAQGPNRLHGTINARILVDGREYGVPGWAISELT